ncbi:MAG TPA: hypothetical protein VF051_02520, partial [Hyphomicrobiaceae bacterium]
MMSKVFEAAVVAFGLTIGFCHWAESGTARAQAKRAEAGNAEEAIRSLTNRERIHRNLAPLKLDRACAQAIAGHVSEMAAGRHLSHQGRNGS